MVSADTLLETNRARARRAVGRTQRIVVTTALIGLATAVALLRQRGTPPWRSIASEDGSIYSEQVLRSHGLSVLFRGYAGYLQLPPRLLAIPVRAVSLPSLSIYLAISATFVGALLAWFIFVATDGWIASWAVRLSLAALIVLMPALGQENTAMITNTIWIFLAVTPWALVANRESPLDVAGRTAVAFLGATASALAFLFIPFGVGQAVVRRSRASKIVLAGYAFGLLLQATVASSSKNQPALRNKLGDLFELLGVRVFGVFTFGVRGTQEVWDAGLRLLIVVVTVLTIVAVAALSRGVSRRTRALSLTFAVYAVVMFVVPVLGRGTTFITRSFSGAPHFEPMGAMRYSVVPVFMLASAFALLVSPTDHASRPSLRAVAAWVFAAQTCLLIVIDFSVSGGRGTYPSWPASVERIANHDCAGAPPERLTKIPTAVFASAYPVELPCRLIARHGSSSAAARGSTSGR